MLAQVQPECAFAATLATGKEVKPGLQRIIARSALHAAPRSGPTRK